MSEYKSLDEIFPDGKPDGRKFLNKAINTNDYFQPYFREESGNWIGISGGLCIVYTPKALFKEYIPPKKTKKITLYNPVYFCSDKPNQFITSVYYHTSKSDFSCQNRIVGWLEMTCEVEE